VITNLVPSPGLPGEEAGVSIGPHAPRWSKSGRQRLRFVRAQPLKHMLDRFGYDGFERNASDFAFD
jgi:hypothetical protein